MRQITSVVIWACLAASACVSCAGPRVSRPGPSPDGFVFPQSTLLKLRLDTPVSSKTSRPGDQIVATLVEPVAVNEQLVLPEGSTVKGLVTEVHPARYQDEGGMVLMSFNRLLLRDGDEIPIRGTLRQIVRSKKANQVEVGLASNVVGRGRSGLAKAVLVVGATTAGAFFGPGQAVGAGVVTYLGTKYLPRGREAALEKGALIVMRLEREMTVPSSSSSQPVKESTRSPSSAPIP